MKTRFKKYEASVKRLKKRNLAPEIENLERIKLFSESGLLKAVLKKNKQVLEKWQIYEAEKKKIQAKNLTPAEYDKEIEKLVKKLKL